MIEVKNITKIFGPTPKKMLEHAKRGMTKSQMHEKYHHGLGLSGINMTINQGEVFVIMGLSGSGKSTLLRHFNRLIEPTDGKIIINGQDVMSLDKHELRKFRRKTMSMVFQHFGLMPHKTVLNNVAYPRIIAGESKATAYEHAQKWLALVGLEGYEQRYPKQLSGGQQQRVGLARALVADTDIILMDEAFSALDPLIRSQMQEQLISLQEKLNKTIVFITHDLSEALRIGNRIAILNEGLIAQIGTPQEILNHPADDYVKEFVSEVNRASILNVQTLMTKPKLLFDTETLQEALAKMKEAAQPWGWVKTGDAYQGLLTLDNLEKAIEESPNSQLTEIIEKPKSVHSTDTIEELLPVSIGNEYPVPVVNDDGELSGIVTPQNIANAVTKE